MFSQLSADVSGTFLSLPDNLEFFLRLLLSAGLGAIVGLERSKRQKEAGIRTHCIIACSSALFMILSKYAFSDISGISEGVKSADPARIAAQVVSGISFLGAGVIFKNGSSIRGLTTAAGMWGTSAIGLAIGSGMYWLGLFEAAILVSVQIILHRFPIGSDALTTQKITVEACDRDEVYARLNALLGEHHAQIVASNLSKNSGRIQLEVTARLDPPVTHDEALLFLKSGDDVLHVSIEFPG